MRTRIATAVVLLLVASPIALALFPTVQAQRATDKRMLPLPAPAAAPPAEASASGYEVVRSGVRQLAPRAGYQDAVMCPSGKKVTGGGVSTGPSGMNTTSSGWHKLAASFPASSGGWMVQGYNEGTAAGTYEVWAICMIVP